MPKVRAFQLPGIECWWWPDDHRPPHFHAKRRGQWELKVAFLADDDSMFTLVWSAKKVPRADLAALKEQAEEFRDELLAEWEATRPQE
jgi:hypothetical protein